jgi:hypothetical protein
MDAQNGYYTDAEEANEPAAQDNPQEEKSEKKPALLPLSFFQGKELKPGDTCTIQIQQVMDDQASVSYVGSDPEEQGETAPDSETTEPSTPPASEDMMG